jgi:hypothetical protein
LETATVKHINERPLIELYRFKKRGGSYDAFTLIVFRLDNEVDLHGFNGEPTITYWRELCEFLKPLGVTHVNALRHGEPVRYRVR